MDSAEYTKRSNAYAVSMALVEPSDFVRMASQLLYDRSVGKQLSGDKFSAAMLEQAHRKLRDIAKCLEEVSPISEEVKEELILQQTDPKAYAEKFFKPTTKG